MVKSLTDDSRKAGSSGGLRRLWSRPPLDRMLRIDAQIRAGKRPNAFTLARDLEVSRKTIIRDIEFMRHRLDLPIEFDPVKNGYEYAGAISQFPLVNVTAAELLALCVSRQAMEQYRGTPFAAPLANAFEKLAGQFRDEISFSWEDLQGGFSFKTTGGAPVPAAAFDAACHAVLERRELEFEYKKLGSSRYEKRVLRPYHLACISGQWYLFGLDTGRNEIRTFVLARMRAVRIQKRTFARPSGFSVQKLLKDSFGVIEGGKPVLVRVRFDAFSAALVRERRWHHSQQIEEMPDGGIVLKMRLGSLVEIKSWILSWGPGAEVLAPAALRKAVAEAHAAAARKYKKGQA